jgi:hypothetical protein
LIVRRMRALSYWADDAFGIRSRIVVLEAVFWGIRDKFFL